MEVISIISDSIKFSLKNSLLKVDSLVSEDLALANSSPCESVNQKRYYVSGVEPFSQLLPQVNTTKSFNQTIK